MLRRNGKPESLALVAVSLLLSIEIVGLTVSAASAQQSNLLWRATIAVGMTPIGVAVDPSTNTVYVANSVTGTVSVISALTNRLTNKVYVSNSNSGTISVISGSTNRVTDTIKVGVKPDGVAVNPSTNMIYVTDAATYNASVISGSTNSIVSTIRVGSNQTGLAVDS